MCFSKLCLNTKTTHFNPDLVGGVSLSQSGCLGLDGVKVHRDAVRDTNLVRPSVATTY